MNFDLNHSIDLLSRTPETLRTLLAGLPNDFVRSDEGDNTWSPYEVLGHLIHGEKTDWVPRAQIIISDRADKTFEPYDRFAQQQADQSRSIEVLLDEFASLRAQNLETLKAMNIMEAKLDKTGIHPALGTATLRELLATWTTHDLGHIAQIARVMAKQYQSEVGPWKAYLGILKA